MITRSTKRLSMRALIVDDELGLTTAEGRAARALVQELQGRSIEVIEATSCEDGTSAFVSDSAIHAVLLDWTLGDDKNNAKARAFLELVRARNDKIPIFLMAERGEASTIPARSDGDGGRIRLDARGHGGIRRRARRRRDPPLPGGPASAARGRADAVQPGIRVLVAHARPHGRHRVPEIAGRADLLRLFRRKPAALGSVDQRRQPGLLLDHTGPIGEHEKYARASSGASHATA